MHDKDRERAARLLGMKRSEIVDVAEVEGGTVITTHDGQRILAMAEGVLSPWTGGVPAAAAAAADEEPQDDEPEPEPVPDGTATEVLAWVGDDRERALRAWEAEAGKDKPRAGLVAQLEKLAQG